MFTSVSPKFSLLCHRSAVTVRRVEVPAVLATHLPRRPPRLCVGLTLTTRDWRGRRILFGVWLHVRVSRSRVSQYRERPPLCVRRRVRLWNPLPKVLTEVPVTCRTLPSVLIEGGTERRRSRTDTFIPVLHPLSSVLSPSDLSHILLPRSRVCGPSTQGLRLNPFSRCTDSTFDKPRKVLTIKSQGGWG